jgi:hypothetical protein
MTLGIAVQGDGWAVLASDTLYTWYGAKQHPYYFYAEKNHQVGPQCWVMWAGAGGRLAQRWWDLPLDPEAVGRLLYDAVHQVHYAARIHQLASGVEVRSGPSPDVLVLMGRPQPTVVRATVDGVVRAGPGEAVATGGTDRSPFPVSDDEVEAKLLVALTLAEGIRQSGGRADFPICMVSTSADGVTHDEITSRQVANPDRLARRFDRRSLKSYLALWLR